MSRILVTIIEYMTGRLWMELSYSQCMRNHDIDLQQDPEHPFFETALKTLKVSTEIASGSIENIPETGALIVVANHPFGIIDGLILNQIMRARRKDYYVLTNEVLLKAERMIPYLLPIDDTETAAGTVKNQKSIMQSMKHIKNGGALCIFPAGRMARPQGWFSPYQDLDWKELVSHFVTRVKESETGKTPTVLPIFFEGENSNFFRFAAVTKFYTLTRSLVINECKNKVGKTIRVHIGKPIEPENIPQNLSYLELAQWLREKTIALGTHS